MVTVNKIRVYEFDGSEIDSSEAIVIENHWNRKAFVVIGVDGHDYTVDAGDLIKAIENAQNAHRY